MATIPDLIQAAHDQSPSTFQQVFNDLMAARLTPTLDDARQAVAQAMFAKGVEQPDTQTQGAPNENSDAAASTA